METSKLKREKQHGSYLKIIVVFLSIITVSLLVILNLSRRPFFALEEDWIKNQKSLVFVQVLLRHGDRTPMARTTYPNDPYKNETYKPYGCGVLTLKGKRNVYNLGKFLRGYYQEYLGDYHADIVYARASPLPRCFTSLLLVLAGLFPPPQSSRFENELNWQPISYYYTPLRNDTTFLYFYNCKKYITLKDELSTKIVRDNRTIKEFAQYLKYHTGANITSIYDIHRIFDHLSTQHALGYKLPQWTDTVFPEPLHTYGVMDLTLPTTINTLRKLSAGFILKEMIDAILLKTKDDPQMRDRKIHLFAGHDFTIAHLLGTFDFKLKQTPAYGSFLSVEVHRIEDGFGIKLLYHDYATEFPETVILPECEEICPLKQFLELYGKYQATPQDCVC